MTSAAAHRRKTESVASIAIIRFRHWLLSTAAAPALSEGPGVHLLAFNAGRMAKPIAEMTETANVNPSTCRSRRTTSSSGLRTGTRRMRTRAIHPAASNPAAPPQAASTRPSMRNWRMRRRRLAPNAERIATSFRLLKTRAKIRLATLAQAIRSTKPTAPSIISRAGRTSPTRSSRIEITDAPQPLLSAG